MNRFLRICRTTHSWLGAMVMPLVLIIGATGFYLNHQEIVLDLMGYSELLDSDLAGAYVYDVNQEMALLIAAAIWPEEPVQQSGFIQYRGERAYGIQKESGMVVVPVPRSNHYFVRTPWAEETYTMEGELVHKQYEVKRVLKSLHERGWVGPRFGTWLADIVAAAMVFFSLSGLIMWSVPKVRRVRKMARTTRQPTGRLTSVDRQ